MAISRSIYEQALASRKATEKPNPAEKVVTLRKGTISDIRNKIFEKKVAGEPVQKPKKAASKKHIIDDKKEKASTVEKVEHSKGQKNPAAAITEAPPNKDASKDDPIEKLRANVKEINENLVAQPEQERATAAKPAEPVKKAKRQSFISDFAALEKTYRMLGIHKEPELSDEGAGSPKPVKKRHASEGKAKKKVKSKSKTDVNKALNPAVVGGSSDPAKDDDINLPDLSAIDKGTSEAKRNYFQEMINEKKAGTQQELSGPKMRRKTNLISSFEEKTKEINKRNSLVKEDIRVSLTLTFPKNALGL